MSLEENKAIVRKVTEALNKQDLSLLDDLMAPDYVDHTYQSRSREVAKQTITPLYKGFPDFQTTIEDIIAEGDKVWVRYKGTGAHTGEFVFGKIRLAPTGKKITTASAVIYRIADGKVVERWSVVDMMGFYKQLGVIEYTEKGKKLFPEDVS